MRDIIDLIFNGKREKAPDGTEWIIDECGIAYPKDLLENKVRNKETLISTLVDCPDKEEVVNTPVCIKETPKVSLSLKEKLTILHSSFAKIDVDQYMQQFRLYQSQSQPSGSYSCLNARFGIPKDIGQTKVCGATGLKVKHWCGKITPEGKRLMPTKYEAADIKLFYKSGKHSVSELSHIYNYPESTIYKTLKES